MKKLILTLIILVLACSAGMAQSVGINSDGTAPDGSAMLDVKSTSKGFLAPRVASTANVTTPATGLLVYQTGGTPGYYYNSGIPATPAWVQLGAASGASQWATAGSDIYYNTGNVGIGTTTPTAKLDVSASGEALRLIGNSNYLTFYNTANTVRTAYIQQNAGTNLDISTNGLPLILNQNGGNVGIGTTTPASKLHIAGADLNNALLLENTSANPGRNFIYFKTQGTNQGYIGLGGSENNNMSIAADGASNNLSLVTGGVERMTIIPSGNVGIGTTTPNNKLQIGSTTYSVNSLAMGNGTQNFAIDISARTIPTFFSDNNFSFMGSGGNGNVGIGTTTPTTKLDVNGSITSNIAVNIQRASSTSAVGDASNIQFSNTGGGYYDLIQGGSAAGIQFYSYIGGGWTERMRIAAIGNVGIGITTPLHPLHMGSGAHVTAAGVWTNGSDARLKTNVVNTNYGLQTVMQLRPVNYTMVKGGEAQVGFLAQEVQKIVPEVVSGTEGDMSKGETLGLSYGNLVPVLTKAIQEQQATIEAQQKQIDELKAQNTVLSSQLKAEIETLKKAINGTTIVQK